LKKTNPMPFSSLPDKRFPDDQADWQLSWQVELELELKSVLTWWRTHSPDDRDKGFHGAIDSRNQPDLSAPKGLVMVSRILWTYSAAHRFLPDAGWEMMATRAFHFLVDRFYDTENQGFFWAVDVEGNPTESRKQVYGQAFALYGLAEYARTFQHEKALQLAIETYERIEQYALDRDWGGYFEAFTQDWKTLDDMRLSAKDANDPKSMNTHLHIVEAYANLYRIWPNEMLRNRIVGLLRIFDLHIIDPETGHLKLFFTLNWRSTQRMYSYGHDIEAAWLLLECASIIEHDVLIQRFRQLALEMGRAALEGLDPEDGGLWYESEPDTHHWIREKHWWPQAEAMVGWWECFQISRDEIFRDASFGAWEFTSKYLIDPSYGEWHWGVDAANNPLGGQTKAGFWKCPYHNGRACLEMMNRLDHIKTT
jgi:mannobiose 2-epimerase